MLICDLHDTYCKLLYRLYLLAILHLVWPPGHTKSSFRLTKTLRNKYPEAFSIAKYRYSSASKIFLLWLLNLND
jgi:hypothetical protein